MLDGHLNNGVLIRRVLLRSRIFFGSKSSTLCRCTCALYLVNWVQGFQRHKYSASTLNMFITELQSECPRVCTLLKVMCQCANAGCLPNLGPLLSKKARPTSAAKRARRDAYARIHFAVRTDSQT